MKMIEKHPMIMIVVGVIGISLSSIFVKFSSAPSSVTAAFRLLWTVLLLTPAAIGKKEVRRKIKTMGRKNLLLSILSGVFLALHFWTWFESLQHTSVASSTTIVCTEVIWVSLGYWMFMKGSLNAKAIGAIAVTFVGSVLIAFADSQAQGMHLYGDLLALAAAIAVAVYVLIGKVVRSSLSTTAYTYVVYSACAAALMVISAAQGQQLFSYGKSALIVGLLLAVFSTILGHSIFSWCLKYFSPSFVSASKLCEPVAASVMAGFLFAEMPSLIQVLGSVLIIAGVLYYSRIEKQKETE